MGTDARRMPRNHRPGERARGDLAESHEHVFALYNADLTRRILVDDLLHQIDIATCIEP